MKRLTSIAVKIFTYSFVTFVALFLLGIAWASVIIFLLEAYDNKFGPWGTFQIYAIISLVVAGIEAGIFLVTQIIWVLINRKFYALWTSRCGLLLFVITAVLPLFVAQNELLELIFVLVCPAISSMLMIIPRIKNR